MSVPSYVYFDNSATTSMDPRVLEAMTPYFSERCGNPSSPHRMGREAYQALDMAREKVAAVIGVQTGEMVFTGGGTESDNLAIIGYALANRSRGEHLITTRAEHPAVLKAFRHLEGLGFKTTYVPVDRDGVLSVEALQASMTKQTILVSVVMANNEIGTVQPIKAAAEIAHEKGAVLHTDAVQALCRMPISIEDQGADMLSLASHKFHGPKGVGALYIKRGLKLGPIAHGGGQEKGLRSSTENVPGIVGMGEAIRLGSLEMDESVPHMRTMRDRLIEGVLAEGEGSFLNGHRTERLCHNAHFCMPGLEGLSLVLALDLAGFATSTGSACSSQGGGVSETLLAIGLRPEQARSSLRLTLSKFNTMEEVERFLDVLPWAMAGVRNVMEAFSGQCGALDTIKRL